MDDRADEFLADVAVVLTDSTGTVLMCSPSAEELLGRPASQVCGRPVLDLLDERPAGALPDSGTLRLARPSGPDVTVRYQVLIPAAAH